MKREAEELVQKVMKIVFFLHFPFSPNRTLLVKMMDNKGKKLLILLKEPSDPKQIIQQKQK